MPPSGSEELQSLHHSETFNLHWERSWRGPEQLDPEQLDLILKLALLCFKQGLDFMTSRDSFQLMLLYVTNKSPLDGRGGTKNPLKNRRELTLHCRDGGMTVRQPTSSMMVEDHPLTRGLTRATLVCCATGRNCMPSPAKQVSHPSSEGFQ